VLNVECKERYRRCEMKYAVVTNHTTVLLAETVIISAAVMAPFMNKALLHKLTRPHLVQELSKFYEKQTFTRPITIKQQQLLGDTYSSRN
jgi:hypothetical protein